MKFKTSIYEGAWIPFDGDRGRFRLEVERALREALSDPDGKLMVDASGPHWSGRDQLVGLSYSNTFSGDKGWGVVVFSRTHALGVDLEKADRMLKTKYLDLAKRFFHPTEYESLKKESVFDGPEKFLELWMKKEAYSKLKREHLVQYLSVALPNDAVFEPLMKIRIGYRVALALSHPP